MVPICNHELLQKSLSWLNCDSSVMSVVVNKRGTDAKYSGLQWCRANTSRSQPSVDWSFMCICAPPPRRIHFPGIACGLFPGNSSCKLISLARSLARSPVCHSRPLFTLTFKISHFAERRTRKSGRADGADGAAVSNAAALAGDLCGRRN